MPPTLAVTDRRRLLTVSWAITIKRHEQYHSIDGIRTTMFSTDPPIANSITT